MNEQESGINAAQDTGKAETFDGFTETGDSFTETYDCLTELMIPYMTGRLDKADTGRLLMHLSICKECRKEYAELHRLTTACTQESSDLPNDIRLHAFDLIEHPKFSSTISKELGIDIVKESFRMLPNCLTPVKDTLQLTLRCIQL